MIKIDEMTYKRILKINPFLVKRTKNGFYVLKGKKFLKKEGDLTNTQKSRRKHKRKW